VHWVADAVLARHGCLILAAGACALPEVRADQMLGMRAVRVSAQGSPGLTDADGRWLRWVRAQPTTEVALSERSPLMAAGRFSDGSVLGTST